MNKERFEKAVPESGKSKSKVEQIQDLSRTGQMEHSKAVKLIAMLVKEEEAREGELDARVDNAFPTPTTRVTLDYHSCYDRINERARAMIIRCVVDRFGGSFFNYKNHAGDNKYVSGNYWHESNSELARDMVWHKVVGGMRNGIITCLLYTSDAADE